MQRTEYADDKGNKIPSPALGYLVQVDEAGNAEKACECGGSDQGRVIMIARRSGICRGGHGY